MMKLSETQERLLSSSQSSGYLDKTDDWFHHLAVTFGGWRVEAEPNKIKTHSLTRGKVFMWNRSENAEEAETELINLKEAKHKQKAKKW